MAMDKRFTPARIEAAQDTQRKYFVPASVTLAQFAIESGYGAHEPAGSNNPFGIKATGREPYVVATTREVISGKSLLEPQNFEKFASEAEAFLAHGLIFTHALYAPAVQAWLAGDLAGGVKLMAAHYATDPNYASTIMSEITTNGLALFDKLPPVPAASVAAAKPATAPAAAATAPVVAAAKATMTTATKAVTPAEAPNPVQAFLSGVLGGIVTKLKDTATAVENGTATAANVTTTATTAIGDVPNALAAAKDIAQLVVEVEKHDWTDIPTTLHDFVNRAIAILGSFKIVLPELTMVQSGLAKLASI